MRILAHTPYFVPYRNSGADTMLYDIMRYMMSKGHECSVIVDDHNLYEFNGIKIHIYRKSDCLEIYKNNDVIITHLGTTGRAIAITDEMKKPIFHFIHNINRETIHEIKPHIIPVYNSKWVKKELNYSQEGIVCRPIAKMQYYQVERTNTQYITLIGLNKNKGGEVLKEIALKMPNHNFLAVKNAYGEQYNNYPSNVKVLEHTHDIQDIYRKTKILLVPSISESWGKVASEAMCSGIPVIYNPTEGLMENISFAGYMVSRNNINGWIDAIKYVEDNYELACQLSNRRARQQNSWMDYEQLEAAFEQSIENNKPSNGFKKMIKKNAVKTEV